MLHMIKKSEIFGSVEKSIERRVFVIPHWISSGNIQKDTG